MKRKLLRVLQIFLITSSITVNSKAQSGVQNLNISFLLDLSDRIDPKKNPGLYQRDLQCIKSVQSAFLKHVKGKKMLLLKDQMQIFFDPIPKITGIDDLSQRLKISFTPKTNKKDILNVEKLYTEIPAAIYQHAIDDNHYVGSDIWRFFKNNVQNYCIKPSYRNILVILTDGYMYHKNSLIQNGGKSSYITPQFLKLKKLISPNYSTIMKKNNLGFITFPSNLNELEIIVLGINPSNGNPYEEDTIKQYWSDWFKAMKVKKFDLLTTDLAANLDPVIQRIVLN